MEEPTLALAVDIIWCTTSGLWSHNNHLPLLCCSLAWPAHYNPEILLHNYNAPILGHQENLQSIFLKNVKVLQSCQLQTPD